MEKLLSIAIPSYNMEKYLNRCLDSFIVEDSDLLKKLEIIIVNDGSKDTTSAIAHEYKNKYPDTFLVIDKENGHYGSCINAALRIATGKYFRIVDADDWVNSEALSRIVKHLETLDCDAVFTKFSTYYEFDNRLEPQPGLECFTWDKVLDLNAFRISPQFLHMHSLTFKLSLIRAIDYKQTEGVCYTDTEYVYKLLGAATGIYCINDSLYQYYVGRDDQSTSKKVQYKNFNHFYKVLLGLINYSFPRPNNNAGYLRDEYYEVLFNYLLPIHLEFSFDNNEQDDLLRTAINQIEAKGESDAFLNRMQRFNYHYADNWRIRKHISRDRLFWRFVKYYDYFIDSLLVFKRKTVG